MTLTSPTIAPTSRPLPRTDRMIAGLAGLAGVVLLGVFISLLTTPDVTAHNATAAINTWLRDPHSAAHVHVALALGAATYPLLLIFAVGVYRIAHSWDPDGPWATVALAGFVLFLAGAIASDAFEFAIPLTLHTAPHLAPNASLVAVFDRGFLIPLYEAQVALAGAIGAVTVAAVRGRRRGADVPLVVIILGIVSVAAVVPLLLAFTTLQVFLLSNQLRLLWIVVTAIWMIVRARRSGNVPAA